MPPLFFVARKNGQQPSGEFRNSFAHIVRHMAPSVSALVLPHVAITVATCLCAPQARWFLLITFDPSESVTTSRMSFMTGAKRQK